MKYVLIKTTECTAGGCDYRGTPVGHIISSYTSYRAYSTDLNEVMQAAEDFNSVAYCKCKCEVKEVE